jgi:NitT/TauT family transport system substrate-binding protein
MQQANIFMIFFLILGILITGCTSPVSQAPQVTPEPIMTTVKVAYQPTASNGPLYIAIDEGYFAEQGINVEFVRTASSTAALPLLLHEDVAVSTGPMRVGLLNAVIQGGHIRIVADKGTVTPGSCVAYGIMVRKDLVEKGVVRNVSDLKGRKIASHDSDYDLFNALAVGNLSRDDVENMDMEFMMISPAFANGAIDAALVTEPYITQIRNNGTAVVLVPGQEFLSGWPLPLYYGPAIIDKDPELGRRFMVAYLKGVKQYNEGKTERNLKVIENYTHLNRDLLNQTCWYTISADGYQSPQPIRKYINWLYANKMISQNLSDDQLLDMSYAAYAYGVLQNFTDGGHSTK